MPKLSTEEFLSSENFWKNDFEVMLVKNCEANGELWKVINKGNKVSVLCCSMLAAFKIANTAMERKLKMPLSIDHENILNRAGILLGFSKERRFANMRRYNKNEAIADKYNIEITRTYICKYHGKFDIEMKISEPDIKTCIICDNKVERVFD